MPGKLLNLTFHGAGVLTGEDLRFKEAAIALKLVTGDAMDEMGGGNGPKPFFDANKDVLLHPPRMSDPSGVDIVKHGSVSLVTLNRLGVRTWVRDGYLRISGPSIFEQWLKKVFAVPIEVLVIAGHHAQGLVWGSEVMAGRQHRPFSAFAASVEKDAQGKRRSILRMYGFGPDRRDPTEFLRAGPFDVTDAFKDCRMLVVLGCNGATEQIIPWRDCIKNATGGRAPFIFGARGVHSFPRDAGGQFMSLNFWSALEALAPGSAGNKNLDFLHDNGFRDRIVQVWRDAMKLSFPKGSPRRHLFFAGPENRGPRGAGAADPNGNVLWVINEAGDIEKREELP